MFYRSRSLLSRCLSNFYKSNKMNFIQKAHIRYQDDADHFQLSFQFKSNVLEVDRQFNFTRKLSENVETFLQRVNSSFDKSLVKFKKRQKRSSATSSQEPAIDIAAILMVDGQVVPDDTLCRDVILGSGNITLRILGTDYSFIKNAPWVSAITLPRSIMIGFSVYPTKCELSLTTKEECIFTWYRSVSLSDISKSKTDEENWTEVGMGYMYIPTLEDIGCKLKLACIPVKNALHGAKLETISQNNVEAGPGYCPFQQRHVFTGSRLAGDGFRVVSYNILADLYADSEVARTELYPYCPPYALQIDYRKQLIMKELVGYNSDIICLQEVDSKVFDFDLQPVLSLFGFHGIYNKKAGAVSEGLSCLFHTSKFKLVSSHIKYLAHDLQSDPLFSDIWERISNHDKLVARLMDRNTCAQFIVLDSLTNSKERLVIGNTHLYFHPNADHIRLLQSGMCVRHLEHIVNASKVEGKRVTALMCGDFNSTPECGVYQLMTTQHVSKDNIDWKSTSAEVVTGISLSHSLPMASACGTPEFTNFTVGFTGCLDYIFYQRDHLNVTQVVPLPSLEEVVLHTALPSVVFPSDHISIVADLRWIPKVD